MIIKFLSLLKQKLVKFLSPGVRPETQPKFETAIQRNKRAREELLEQLKNGTFKVCSLELSRIQAPMSIQKKMSTGLNRIAKESGLINK